MVLLMNAQMIIVKMVDLFCEDSNLYLRRTCIALMRCKLLDDLLLTLLCHVKVTSYKYNYHPVPGMRW